MNKKLKGALFPGAVLAKKAMDRHNEPDRQAARGQAAEEKNVAKQAREAEKEAAKQAKEAKKEQLYAKYAPGLAGAIRLYKDGTIESRFGSGNVRGATAKVDQSGSQRILRDTRQTYLTIEGPHVSIAVTVASNNRMAVSQARRFAASANRLAQQLGGSQIAATSRAANTDVPEQIKKLADLRDQGILSSDEFEAKKTELLSRL
jgi:hypothetical protein